jgi:hypothetical protein
MSNIFWAAAIKPLIVALLASFLLAIRKVFIKLCPDGLLKTLLLRELWLTDWERRTRGRAGHLLVRLPRQRSLAWYSAGHRAGAWARKRLF